MAVELSSLGKLFPANNRVAVLGDSRTNLNANGTGKYNSRGYLNWTRMLTGQRIEFSHVRNFGVDGDTTAQILARTDAALAATDAAIWIVLGGTNDFAAGTAAATTIANLQAIRDKITAAGRICIFIAETPRGDTTFTSPILSASNLANLNIVRRWLLTQNGAGCYVADPWPYMAVPSATNGSAVLGMTIDGLHPASLGAYAIGRALVALLNQIVAPLPLAPASNSEIKTADFPSGWANSNPMMTGTAGTVTPGTGNLADGWVCSDSASLTYTFAKVTVDGREWQQVTISGTVGTGFKDMAIRQAISGGTWSAGDVIEGVGEVAWDAITGVKSASVILTNRTTFATYGDVYFDSSSGPLPANLSGIQRTPQLTLDATTAGHIHWVALDLVFEPSATVNAVVRLGSCGARKVS